MHVTRTSSIFSLCLILFSALSGGLSSAAAQQQEKRIALVVGNGAYAKAPLATAANDAGLIAQTLQAAGFDVVGARDLDGETLRRSFRDFMQKAEESGPGTVAMVYLAGYGMQLAGENYFIPVDSALSRDVDIPIEGLRISDYLRQLASLPLKASVVVLDAARQQPFVEGGQPIASGLSLVEPDAHMLIAFNAAPGTIAPNEQGPYGVYAQALAEMIRTGGLALPEVFNRVRLRANEASKGALVPWDAEKIDTQFLFFDRAPDAPPQAPADQVAAIRSRPIRDLGVQDAYAAALERDTMQGYEDFLAAYPGDPLAKRVRAIVAARREAITWLRTYRADTPQAYWSYLRRYSRGPHASDARRRLAILTAPLEPPPAFAVLDYDVPPPPPDEIVYVDRPVLMFSDPDFDFAPPPPPPVFFLPPPPPDFVVLEPPPPPIGLFILPQPVFVPIPVYVQAPVYVAPPPNNIIFANIHNTTVINNVINQNNVVNQPAQPGPAVPGVPPVAPGAPSAQPNAAAAPVSPAGRAAAGQGGVTRAAIGPALPAAAQQRASLIQQGKLPMPRSALINPPAKPGTPGAPSGSKAGPPTPTPTNVTPNALPPNQAVPRANALPVPGTKGAPPVPLGGRGPAPNVPNSNAKLAPAPPPPATAAPNLPAAAGSPKAGTSAPAPLVGQPKAGGSAQVPEAKPPAVPEGARKPVPPPPPPPKSAAAPAKPVLPTAPQPQSQRAEPPRPSPPPRSAPRPAQQAARPAPPSPTRPAQPPPPRPAPQIARPAPPSPPRPAPPAPPRPAPQIARTAPPPPPRPAPPPPPPRPAPQIARPASPPPPPQRPAAPPPRPAAPPAAKKCPPDAPKC
jgi:uncharacterized caspase-like protein